MQTLGYLETIDYFLPMKTLENLLAKVVGFSFVSAAPTDQNGPRMNFHIENASQDTSVLF